MIDLNARLDELEEDLNYRLYGRRRHGDNFEDIYDVVFVVEKIFEYITLLRKQDSENKPLKS